MKPRTKFGRCPCRGHGGVCEVTIEIQNTPLPRTTEKSNWKKQAKKDGWKGF